MSDDLINRQKAIKAIEGLPDCYNGFSDTYDKACIIGVLEELPSAEPEIIRCKDCEYYTEEERWCRRLGLCGAFDQNDYCSHAERRNDDCN